MSRAPRPGSVRLRLSETVVGLGAVGVALAALVASSLATVSAGPAAGPAVTPVPASTAPPPARGPLLGAPERAPDGRTLTPEGFGAAGDGRTDDTLALRAALAALRAGDVLELPAGATYLHTDVLEITSPGVTLAGPGALLAGDEERSALKVSASDVTVRDVVLRIAQTTQRWSGLDQHRLMVGAQQGLVVRGVRVEGSAGSGIFVQGATDFRIENVTVSRTRADGIHMTGAASYGTVVRPLIVQSGDDAVAVVSYDKDPGVTHHITVDAPEVRGTTGGRGISVVGGEDVVYRDVSIADTRAAAVYVATEGEPYYTRGARRVQVLGGRVSGANRDASIDHGALLVAAGRPDVPVTDVELADLAVSGTRPQAFSQVGLRGSGATVQRVRLARITVTGGGRVLHADEGVEDYEARDWVVDGRERDSLRGA